MPSPESTGATSAPAIRPAAVGALFLACLLPFAGKPFHLDDPMYVWAAQQITRSPLDFYGFDVNWHGTVTPMSVVMKNPPGVSYYLAAVGALAGWSEGAMHLSLFLAALGVVLGTYSLARLFTERAGEAALAAAFTPVLFVSSTTVMSDVLMLCIWVWSLLAWIEGIRRNVPGLLALAALGAAAAALTKYFGMGLLLLFVLYGGLRERRFWRWAPWLLLPLAALAAYQAGTEQMYGRGLLLDASSYASAVRSRSQWEAAPKILIGLAFTGGCFATVLWYGPWIWTRRALAGWLVTTGAVVVLLAVLGSLGAHSLRDGGGGLRWALLIQIAVAIVTGASVVVLAALDLAHDRSPEGALLAAWTAGTLLFAVGLNWGVNGRALLPMAPVVGILLARRLDRRAGKGVLVRRMSSRWALVPAALLAFAVSWADLQLARTSREAAGVLAARLGGQPGTVWFQGHWGFQYYAQLLGFRPLDYRRPAVAAGDLIIKPDGISNPIALPPETVRLEGELLLDGPAGLSTMSIPAGAGFYSDVWGPIPYVFGPIPPERYRIFKAVIPMIAP